MKFGNRGHFPSRNNNSCNNNKNGGEDGDGNGNKNRPVYKEKHDRICCWCGRNIRNAALEKPGKLNILLYVLCMHFKK